MAQQEKDKKRGKWGEGLMFDPVQINKLYTFIKSKANGSSTKHMSQKRTANVIENKVGFALISVLPPSSPLPSSLCFFCCCPCSACNASCCTQVALSVATAAPSPGYAATQPLISFASYSPPTLPSSPSSLVSFSFSEKAKRRMKIAFN